MSKTLNRLLLGAIMAGLIGCDIAAAETKTPMERVTSTPRGQRKSPYPLSPGNAFQKQGFVRKGSENVVGPMPPYGDIIATDDDIWKIIAWIRAKNCERDAARC